MVSDTASWSSMAGLCISNCKPSFIPGPLSDWLSYTGWNCTLFLGVGQVEPKAAISNTGSRRRQVVLGALGLRKIATTRSGYRCLLGRAPVPATPSCVALLCSSVTSQPPHARSTKGPYEQRGSCPLKSAAGAASRRSRAPRRSVGEHVDQGPDHLVIPLIWHFCCAVNEHP